MCFWDHMNGKVLSQKVITYVLFYITVLQMISPHSSEQIAKFSHKIHVFPYVPSHTTITLHITTQPSS